MNQYEHLDVFIFENTKKGKKKWEQHTHTKKFIFRCQLYESHKIKEFKNINVVREINQVLCYLRENAKKYHMLSTGWFF